MILYINTKLTAAVFILVYGGSYDKDLLIECGGYARFGLECIKPEYIFCC